MTPEIVIGCPGAGKTSYLLDIVEQELARGTAPDRIGFLSFTRQAAGVAVERATKRFGLTKTQLPWVRTLHSLAFKALGLSVGEVLEGKRIQEFGAYAGVRLTSKRSDDGTLAGYTEADRALHMENLARVRCVPLEQEYKRDHDDLAWSQVDRVARCLSAYKAALGLVDYTDMLALAAEGGALPRLDVLIIDESQDNTQLQWRLVAQLARGCRRVVVGADDNQAIFLWAGADVDHLLNLPGQLTTLENSNRVPAAVQPLAETVIGRVRARKIQQWNPRPGDPGQIARAAHFAHVDVSGPDVLVLARNSFVLREHVEPELRRAGVIYERAGRPSVRPQVLEAVRAWESLRRGERVPVEAARAAYDQMTAGRGVERGHKQLSGFTEAHDVGIVDLEARGGLKVMGPWFEALDRIPQGDVAYIRAALARGEQLSAKPRVRLSTIHGAKGAEAEHVVLMREMARRSYDEMQRDPDAEARVWYVGTTRAKQQLTVVESQTNLRCPWI